MSSEPIIAAHDLGKRYQLYARPSDRLKQFLWRGRKGFGKEFWALRDVSFELGRGEVLGIVGRNGAGKSTLLQIVCGTLQPTTGNLAVRGRVAALLELGAGFNPDFSGRENVFLNAAILGVPDEEIRDKFEAIVDFSGIRDFIDQPVKTYSSGMMVRLAFAVATSIEPDILVIDEALSVGDGAFARKSFERIMALKDKGATILFCSHSTYHIDVLCERALWLDRGQVRLFGAAQTVMAAYNDFLAQEAPPSAPVLSAAPTAAAGMARIVTVTGRCEGLEGNRLPVLSRRSTLAVTVEFVADPTLPCPSVALVIENTTGLGVTSALGRAQDGAVAGSADGRGRATVVFPAIALLKGTYHVTIFLACEHALHVYDSAPRCIALEVTQEDVLQGVVALPHRWELPGD